METNEISLSDIEFDFEKCDGSVNTGAATPSNHIICDCCGEKATFYTQFGSNSHKFCMKCTLGIKVAIDMFNDKKRKNELFEGSE